MSKTRDVPLRFVTEHEKEEGEADKCLASQIECEKTAHKEIRAKKKHWGSRLEFLFAIVGYTVGVGSVWRFPMKCASNGGGAFLIPFLLIMIVGGGPLYYIEVCIGQYSGKAAASAFEFCPLFKGLGYLMVVMSFTFVWYNISIIGWIQYYLVNSFATTLPWTTCDNPWNTHLCKGMGDSTERANATVSSISNTTVIISPAMEFWMHNVLNMSDGLESMGQVQWHLVLSNLVAWALLVAALIKGVGSLGKVVYVTATTPYILLTILLIRGLTLDGAMDGVLWYITPEFSKLREPQVWLDAATQVFYSLGLTYGGVISMSSHNKFTHKSFTDVVICIVADMFTAFYAGLAVFAILGFMAKETGTSVEELAKASGPGLAFVAYPEAISRMPLPQLWAFLFFLTLLAMVFDSMFATYETVIDSVCDQFPGASRRSGFRCTILIGLAVLLFLLGIPLAMSGGIYLFKLLDWYMAAFALLFGASVECFIVCWIYGSDHLAYNIEMMTGRKCSVMLRFIWGVPMTSTFLICFVVSVFKFSEPNYGDGYVYQPYAITLGLVLALAPIILVFVFIIQQLYMADGSLTQRIVSLLKPSSKWQPVDLDAREQCIARPYCTPTGLLARTKRNFFGSENTPWI